MTDFEKWIARVESEVAAEVDPAAYRTYYDAGMTPAEAVAADRASD